MKLYTEFEVRKAIELARDTHQEGKPYLEKDEYDYSVDEIVNYLLTPIELPSDEEIREWAKMQSLGEPTGAEEFGRIYGAKYMRDIIQGGSHE